MSQREGSCKAEPCDKCIELGHMCDGCYEKYHWKEGDMIE